MEVLFYSAVTFAFGIIILASIALWMRAVDWLGCRFRWSIEAEAAVFALVPMFWASLAAGALLAGLSA